MIKKTHVAHCCRTPPLKRTRPLPSPHVPSCSGLDPQLSWPVAPVLASPGAELGVGHWQVWLLEPNYRQPLADSKRA